MALITETLAMPTESAPITVLFVEPEPSHRDVVQRLLLSLGFRVIVVETFFDARSAMDSEPPRLLVTELRLGAYNGLHLVVRGKQRRQDMAAVVVTEWTDPLLQDEAELQGATFVPKPVTEPEFLAAVARTCARGPLDHAHIRPPFERRQMMRRVASLATAYEQDRRLAERRRSDLLAAR
jgi:DNA-binding NtrC family response regulator